MSTAFIGSGNLHIAVFARFFLRFVAPASGHHEISRTAARNIQRHDGVFCQSAALHEQDFEVLRDCHEFTKIGFSMLVN